MVLALSSCATLERDDLSSYVEQLHSDAAEGALLAGQAAARRAPVVFVWLHSAELEHHVGELRDHLDGEMPSRGLTGQVHIAKVLSEEVSHELGRLHSAANDRAVARAVAGGLASRAQEAESLYEELK
jgi:hypothetical protein